MEPDCKGEECSGPTHETAVCNQQDCRRASVMENLNPVPSLRRSLVCVAGVGLLQQELWNWGWLAV